MKLVRITKIQIIISKILLVTTKPAGNCKYCLLTLYNVAVTRAMLPWRACLIDTLSGQAISGRDTTINIIDLSLILVSYTLEDSSLGSWKNKYF